MSYYLSQLEGDARRAECERNDLAMETGGQIGAMVAWDRGACGHLHCHDSGECAFAPMNTGATVVHAPCRTQQ